jgi:hypothetical protein
MPDQKNFKVIVAIPNGSTQLFNIRAAQYILSDNTYIFSNGPGTDHLAIFPRGSVLAIIEESAIAK